MKRKKSVCGDKLDKNKVFIIKVFMIKRETKVLLDYLIKIISSFLACPKIWLKTLSTSGKLTSFFSLKKKKKVLENLTNIKQLLILMKFPDECFCVLKNNKKNKTSVSPTYLFYEIK